MIVTIVITLSCVWLFNPPSSSARNQGCSVAQSCPTSCSPMDCSTPGFPVHHQLPELAQIHIHWVDDAVQPSHPLWSPSPPAFSLSQHQGLFWWVSPSHQVARVLELQHQSFQWVEWLQGWVPLGFMGLLSLLSKGLSRIFSNTTVQKHQFYGAQPFFIVQLSHLYMTIGKTIGLTRQTFVSKVISLFFNMLSRFVIAFLPRSLLISWLQSPSTLEPKKINVCHCSHCFPVCLPWSDWTWCSVLRFFPVLSFRTAISLSSFTFIKRLLNSSLCAVMLMSSTYVRLLMFLPAILIPTCASSSLALPDVLCIEVK